MALYNHRPEHSNSPPLPFPSRHALSLSSSLSSSLPSRQLTMPSTMVARKFAVRFNDADFDVDYDTDDGLEVFKYQLFSLTSIPPDQQKMVSGEHNRVVADDFDLVEISDKIRLVSIEEDRVGWESGSGNEKLSGGFEMSDEE